MSHSFLPAAPVTDVQVVAENALDPAIEAVRAKQELQASRSELYRIWLPVVAILKVAGLSCARGGLIIPGFCLFLLGLTIVTSILVRLAWYDRTGQ